MHGSDGRLDRVGPQALCLEGAAYQRRALGDERAVPTRAILFVEEHEFAIRRRARLAARLVQQHERQQTLCFGFGDQLHEQTAKPDCFAREVRARRRIAAACRIAFVEHQVHHAQHALEALR